MRDLDIIIRLFIKLIGKVVEGLKTKLSTNRKLPFCSEFCILFIPGMKLGNCSDPLLFNVNK